jgi:hypothetical protein
MLFLGTLLYNVWKFDRVWLTPEGLPAALQFSAIKNAALVSKDRKYVHTARYTSSPSFQGWGGRSHTHKESKVGVLKTGARRAFGTALDE